MKQASLPTLSSLMIPQYAEHGDTSLEYALKSPAALHRCRIDAPLPAAGLLAYVCHTRPPYASLWTYILVISGSPLPCTIHKNFHPYLS